MASHANRDVEICQSKCHYLIVTVVVVDAAGVFPPFFPGDLGLAFAGRGLFYDIPVRYFSVALGIDSLRMLPSGILHWVPQPGNGVCLLVKEVQAIPTALDVRLLARRIPPNTKCASDNRPEAFQGLSVGKRTAALWLCGTA